MGEDRRERDLALRGARARDDDEEASRRRGGARDVVVERPEGAEEDLVLPVVAADRLPRRSARGDPRGRAVLVGPRPRRDDLHRRPERRQGERGAEDRREDRGRDPLFAPAPPPVAEPRERGLRPARRQDADGGGEEDRHARPRPWVGPREGSAEREDAGTDQGDEARPFSSSRERHGAEERHRDEEAVRGLERLVEHLRAPRERPERHREGVSAVGKGLRPAGLHLRVALCADRAEDERDERGERKRRGEEPRGEERPPRPQDRGEHREEEAAEDEPGGIRQPDEEREERRGEEERPGRRTSLERGEEAEGEDGDEDVARVRLGLDRVPEEAVGDGEEEDGERGGRGREEPPGERGEEEERGEAREEGREPERRHPVAEEERDGADERHEERRRRLGVDERPEEVGEGESERREDEGGLVVPDRGVPEEVSEAERDAEGDRGSEERLFARDGGPHARPPVATPTVESDRVQGLEEGTPAGGAAPARAWFRPAAARRLVVLVFALAVVIQGASSIIVPRGDLGNHVEWARRLLDGRELYAGGLNLPYTPAWALVHAPLVPFPPRVAAAAAFLVGLLAAAVVLAALRRLARPAPTEDGAFAASALALALAGRFVLRDLADGGPNLALLALVLSGLLLWARGRDAAGGALVGVATALKWTPGLFLAWLAWKREWRAFAAGLAAAAALTAAPALVNGPAWLAAHLGTWGRNVAAGVASADPATAVLGPEAAGNLALRPALARLLAAPPASLPSDRATWPGLLGLPPGTASVATALAALALLAAVAWRLRGPVPSREAPEVAVEIAAVALLALLLSPIAWRSHVVAALPALFLLARRALARGRLSRAEGLLLAAWVPLALLPGRDLVGSRASDAILAWGAPTALLLGLLALLLAGRGAEEKTARGEESDA